MNLNKLLAIIIFILACKILYADTVAYYVTPPTPAGTIQGGVTGKTAGDVISVTTDADISARCDFGKQIVVTKTSVLCVFNGKQPKS